MTDLDKVTYLRMRKAFGNGNEKRGRAIMQAIALRLEHARREHPVEEWSGNSAKYGLSVIEAEVSELRYAAKYEAPGRVTEEALDVVATAVRFLGEEYK